MNLLIRVAVVNTCFLKGDTMALIWVLFLIHYGLVTPFGDRDLRQHQLR